MKVIFSSFYSRWWRVLSRGGMWVRRSVIIPLKLWLSANLRGIKDSVPLTTLCSVHCHCWWGTYSEEKLCNKCFATVRKLYNGTKDHATAQKTCNSTKTRQQHQKLRKSAKNHATVPNKNAALLKTVQQHQKFCNSTKNREMARGTVQRHQKPLTTWLPIPECQVPPTARERTALKVT